jgi:Ca-activated chloride channel family protein
MNKIGETLLTMAAKGARKGTVIRIVESVTPRRAVAALSLAAAVPLLAAGQQRPESTDPAFVFRTGVELINVTATVTDPRGRFVSGLTKDDFMVYQDGELVEVTQFNNERVPVSLGIAIDTSGSMEGRKMDAARQALDRFLYDLLGPDDEIFLYRFSYTAVLLQDWTIDRDRLSRAIREIRPRGGTALYDAVADSVPQLAEGRHTKKALLIISDGVDNNSETRVRELQNLIQQNEALIYAIGIDGDSGRSRRTRRPPIGIPTPTPFPFPGGGRRPPQLPRGRNPIQAGQDDRVDVTALRDLTDDSGGRTEIIRDADDLDPATEGIARELSQQYYLGYPAQTEKDGRWHSIRVEVRDPDYRVRARRGYTATP